MATLTESFDGLAIEDWLRLLPASCLRQYVSNAAGTATISRLPNGCSLADLSHEIERHTELRQALARLKRVLRSRDIEGVRPVRTNWIVPDSLGFCIEGKGRTLARRRDHLCNVLDDLAEDPEQSTTRRRALCRLAELIRASRAHPTWLYWYSPQTISLARSTSHQTLFEVNRLAALALNALGLDVTIASWEEAVGVVTRRLPISLLLEHHPTRRTTRLTTKLERCGISTLGGLTVLSTDSLDLLRATRFSTFESCAFAFRESHLLPAS